MKYYIQQRTQTDQAPMSQRCPAPHLTSQCSNFQQNPIFNLEDCSDVNANNQT